jgi:hypothetical protein
MSNDLIQLLGWIDFCEREFPGKDTHIPVWLCPHEYLKKACEDGFIEQKGLQPLIPRIGMNSVIFGLTDLGRRTLYSTLPRAGEKPGVVKFRRT